MDTLICYTIEEIAKILKVSTRTVNRMIAMKQLDCLSFGGRTKRITKEQLDEFIERRTPIVKRPSVKF